MVSRKSKLGTWYRMDGAWHLIRVTSENKLVPGGLILQQRKDYRWSLDMFQLHTNGTLSFATTFGLFKNLKGGMNYADEVFAAFL